MEDELIVGEALAFMFESAAIPRIAPWAADAEERDSAYEECWKGIEVSAQLRT